jgi:hypothetical protein
MSFMRRSASAGNRGRTLKYEDFRARALQHVDLPIDRVGGELATLA